MQRLLLVFAAVACALLFWLGLGAGTPVQSQNATEGAAPSLQTAIPKHSLPPSSRSESQSANTQQVADNLSSPQLSQQPTPTSVLPESVTSLSAAPKNSAADLASAKEVGPATASVINAPEGIRSGIPPLQGSPAPPTTAPQSASRVTPNFQWPLALQELDLQAAALSPEQLLTLDEIADEFITKIGGEDQAATDPTYRKRWKTQQPNADQQFRTLHGTQAFMRAQLSATHEATTPPPATDP